MAKVTAAELEEMKAEFARLLEAASQECHDATCFTSAPDYWISAANRAQTARYLAGDAEKIAKRIARVAAPVDFVADVSKGARDAAVGCYVVNRDHDPAARRSRWLGWNAHHRPFATNPTPINPSSPSPPGRE